LSSCQIQSYAKRMLHTPQATVGPVESNFPLRRLRYSQPISINTSLSPRPGMHFTANMAPESPGHTVIWDPSSNLGEPPPTSLFTNICLLTKLQVTPQKRPAVAVLRSKRQFLLWFFHVKASTKPTLTRLRYRDSTQAAIRRRLIHQSTA